MAMSSAWLRGCGAASRWRLWLAQHPIGLEGRPGGRRWSVLLAAAGIVAITLAITADHPAIYAVDSWDASARLLLSWLTEFGGSRAYFLAAAIWLILTGLAQTWRAVRPAALVVMLVCGVVLIGLAFGIESDGTRERAGNFYAGLMLLTLAIGRVGVRFVPVVVLVVVSVAVSGILVNLIKPVAGHTRPKMLLNDGVDEWVPFSLGYDYASFPSGHAATAGSVGGTVAMTFPAIRVPVLILSTLTASTRVGTLSHYPSDVVVGLWLGWVTPGVLAGIARRTIRPQSESDPS
ncbi:MAG: phosphatase PAP2 family protein [Phycisphaeraceae bacterium]